MILGHTMRLFVLAIILFSATISAKPMKNLWQIELRGNYVYALFCDVFEIIDVADKTKPKVIKTFTMNELHIGNFKNQKPVEFILWQNRICLFDAKIVRTIDITDPVNPLLLPEILPLGGSYLALLGEDCKYAYFINSSGAFTITDLSDQENPRIIKPLKNLAIPEITENQIHLMNELIQNAKYLMVYKNYAYIVSYRGNDSIILALDVTNPAKPIGVNFYIHPGINITQIISNPNGGNIVYFKGISRANGVTCVHVCDCSNHIEPSVLNVLEINGWHSNQLFKNQIIDNKIYIPRYLEESYDNRLNPELLPLGENPEGMNIIDLSDPFNPKVITSKQHYIPAIVKANYDKELKEILKHQFTTFRHQRLIFAEDLQIQEDNKLDHNIGIMILDNLLKQTTTGIFKVLE